jgi:hypothetical protein
MGKVIFGMAMSLDGFVNDHHGSVSQPDHAPLLLLAGRSK